MFCFRPVHVFLLALGYALASPLLWAEDPGITRLKSQIIPMRDGVELSTDLYFPVDHQGRSPVILVRTVYNKNQTSGWNPVWTELVKQGYVVAIGGHCCARFPTCAVVATCSTGVAPTVVPTARVMAACGLEEPAGSPALSPGTGYPSRPTAGKYAFAGVKCVAWRMAGSAKPTCYWT